MRENCSKWSEFDIVAFEKIRLAIINHSPLVTFNPKRAFFIASDACDTGYRGVVLLT